MCGILMVQEANKGPPIWGEYWYQHQPVSKNYKHDETKISTLLDLTWILKSKFFRAFHQNIQQKSS